MNIFLSQHLFFPITIWSAVKALVALFGIWLGWRCAHKKGKKHCAKIDGLLIAVLFIFLGFKYLIAPFFLFPDSITEKILTLAIIITASMLFGTAFSSWRENKRKNAT